MKIRSVLFFIAISIVTTLISKSASADPLSIELDSESVTIFNCHDFIFSGSADGGSPPYSFSFSGAPAGTMLEVQEDDHIFDISGTPTETGTFNISITVEDEDGETETTTFTLTVNPNTPLPYDH